MDGSSLGIVAPMAKEPAISPDGQRIAFIGYRDGSVFEEDDTHRYSLGELYVANIDGSGLMRLTSTETVAESSPSWDPSGRQIAYIALPTRTKYFNSFNFLFPEGNSVMIINPGGTCPTSVLSNTEQAQYEVAWQPGAGREAAPLVC